MINFQNSQYTPDEVCADFRRVLRERASSHSKFYRRLSTSPAIRRLTEPSNYDDGDHHCNNVANDSNIEIKDNGKKSDDCNGKKDKVNRNEFVLANLPSSSQQVLRSHPSVGGLSSLRTQSLSQLSSAKSSPLRSLDSAIVNHRLTSVSVDEIEFVDRYHSDTFDDDDDDTASVMSAGKVTLMPLYARSSSSLEKCADRGTSASEADSIESNNAVAPTIDEQLADEAHLPPIADGNVHEHYCGGSGFSSIDGGVNIEPITDDNISSTASETKSSKACDCEFADNKSFDAINNNNKTCEQHGSDRSDYSTFVRETSFDRATSNSDDKTECYQSNRYSSRESIEGPSTPTNGTIEKDSYDGGASVEEEADDCSQSVTACDKFHRGHIDLLLAQQQHSNFPCVDKLVKMYTKLLQDKKSENRSLPVENGGDEKSQTVNDVNDRNVKLTETLQITSDTNRTSPVSDEGCPQPGSPYSSDCEDNENAEHNKEKVLRSSSNDSALDLDDELPMEPPPTNTGRRMTLTVTDIPLRPALLPVAEPHSLPDSAILLDPQPVQPIVEKTAIPSKVILEERLVEIAEDKVRSPSNSRRESAQSCLSDFSPSELAGVRYVRTPSVVVSDYSGDVLCGVTLEEIEYFRAHRMRRRSSADTNLTEKDDVASDLSVASSCSNLNYCGSSISALDGTEYFVNGERIPIDRKVSDCSTCSTVSGDDEDETYILQDEEYNGQRKDSLTVDEKKQALKKVRHPKFIN